VLLRFGPSLRSMASPAHRPACCRTTAVVVASRLPLPACSPPACSGLASRCPVRRGRPAGGPGSWGPAVTFALRSAWGAAVLLLGAGPGGPLAPWACGAPRGAARWPCCRRSRLASPLLFRRPGAWPRVLGLCGPAAWRLRHAALSPSFGELCLGGTPRSSSGAAVRFHTCLFACLPLVLRALL
jgi:hypothetical protein